MQVGVSVQDVTPVLDPAGPTIWLAGHRRGRAADRIEQALTVRAVVFDDGLRRAALVTVDSFGLDRDLVCDVRDRVDLRAHRIDHLMITAAHTYGAPDLIGLWGPAPLNSGVSSDYRKLVEDQIVRAIVTACATMRVAHLREVELPGANALLCQDDRGSAIASLVARAPETRVDSRTDRVIRPGSATQMRDSLEKRCGGRCLVFTGSVEEEPSAASQLVGSGAPTMLEFGLRELDLPLTHPRWALAQELGVLGRRSCVRTADGVFLRTEASWLRVGSVVFLGVPGSLRAAELMSREPFASLRPFVLSSTNDHVGDLNRIAPGRGTATEVVGQLVAPCPDAGGKVIAALSRDLSAVFAESRAAPEERVLELS